VYKPLKTGRLEFGAILFPYKGKTQKSQVIFINVGKSAPQSKEILFRAIVDKKSPYLGEQVNFTLRLQYKPNAPIRNPRPPNVQLELKGDFIVKPLFSELRKIRPNVREFNKEQWVVFDIKYALFPLRSGEITIPGMKGHFEQIIRTRSRRQFSDPFFGDDFFNSFFGNTGRALKKTAFTNAVKMRVRSLPEENKPGNFSGTVGELSLKGTWDKRELKTGEALTLNLVLEGRGNVNTFKRPALPPLAGFDIFDPEIKPVSGTSSGRITGRKEFKFVMIPKNKGTQTIGAFTYTYFNPRQGKYVTLKTEPYSVNIEQGESTADIGSRRILSKEDIRLLGRDIRYIKTGESVSNQRATLYRNSGFLGLQVIPFLFLIFGAFARRRREVLEKDVGYARSSRAMKKARKGIAQVKAVINEPGTKAFYDHLSRVLNEYLGDKLNLAPAGLTWDQAEERLEQLSIPDDLNKKIRDLYSEFDFVRFASGSVNDEQKTKSLNSLKQILTEFEKKVR
jgi:hypothetical protein